LLDYVHLTGELITKRRKDADMRLRLIRRKATIGQQFFRVLLVILGSKKRDL
jgi:hypothetical protein